MSPETNNNGNQSVIPTNYNRNLQIESVAQQTNVANNVKAQTSLDVTEQIIRYNQLYGASDNTQPNSLSASKSLNYAHAPTLQQAQRFRIQMMPFTLNFQNIVGLFGAENQYVRIDVDIVEFANECGIVVGDYFEACITYLPDPEQNTYQPAIIDPLDDLFIVNTYEPAEISGTTPVLDHPKIKVDVNNLKTGNIYIDNWLDVMVYTKRGEMWPYDTIYLNPKDFFYIGFHARNTRRLPFNVDAVIEGEFTEASLIADKYLIDYGGY